MEGVLKGYDQLLNLVLDETVEYARGGPSLVDAIIMCHGLKAAACAQACPLMMQTQRTC